MSDDPILFTKIPKIYKIYQPPPKKKTPTTTQQTNKSPPPLPNKKPTAIPPPKNQQSFDCIHGNPNLYKMTSSVSMAAKFTERLNGRFLLMPVNLG